MLLFLSNENIKQSNVVKSIICIFDFAFHRLFSTQTLQGCCLMQWLSAIWQTLINKAVMMFTEELDMQRTGRYVWITFTDEQVYSGLPGYIKALFKQKRSKTVSLQYYQLLTLLKHPIFTPLYYSGKAQLGLHTVS